MEYRRAAGLCYKCGERYHSGHVCQRKGLHVLQGVDEPFEVYDEGRLTEEEAEEGGGVAEGEQTEQLEIGVSIHALSKRNRKRLLRCKEKQKINC